MRMRSFSLVAIALGAAPALADDTHYQDYVVGGRAAALGGAYAALSDDASGVYYNPAGLTDARWLSLSVSTSLYGIERGTVSGEQAIADVKDLSFNDVNIIAGEAGGVKTFQMHPQRGANYAVGFVVEVPSYRSLKIREVDAGSEFSSDYDRRLLDRTLWIGGAGAIRVNHMLSLGLSAFYLLRTFEESEDSLFTWQTSAADGSVGFAQRKVRLSATHHSALAILGAKLKTGPFWSFGLALGSPTLSIHGGGQASFQGAMANPEAPAGEPRTVQLSIPGPGEPDRVAAIESESRLGAFARAGLAYTVPKTSTWTLDATVHLPTRYDLIRTRNPALKALLAEDFSIERPVRRKLVVNVNTGYEYLVVPGQFSLSVGAFTDFSSAPTAQEQLAENPSVRPLPRVHLVGLTGALGYFGEHTLTRIGISASTSIAGKDSIRSLRDLANVTKLANLAEIDVSQSFLYIFLASTFRY